MDKIWSNDQRIPKNNFLFLSVQGNREFENSMKRN